MKILAINGSPRKSWNTATLLQEALKGRLPSDALCGGKHERGVVTDENTSGLRTDPVCRGIGFHVALQRIVTQFLIRAIEEPGLFVHWQLASLPLAGR